MNIILFTDVEFFTLFNLSGLTCTENSPMDSINASVIASFEADNEYNYEAVVQELYGAGFLVELNIEGSKEVRLLPKKEIYTILEWIAKPQETISFRRAALVSEPVTHFVRYKETYLRLSILGDGKVCISLPYTKVDMLNFFSCELTADYSFVKSEGVCKKVDYKLTLLEMLTINGLVACEEKFSVSEPVRAEEVVAAIVLLSHEKKLPQIVNNTIVLKDLNTEFIGKSLLKLSEKNILVKKDDQYKIEGDKRKILAPKKLLDFIGIKIDNKMDNAKIIHVLPYGISLVYSSFENGESYINYSYLPYETSNIELFNNAIVEIF